MKNLKDIIEDRDTIEDLELTFPCEHNDIDMYERCCLDCGQDLTEYINLIYEYRYEGDR